MGAYILRRLLLVIPTLLGIMIINFALVQFVPGGPIDQVIAQLEGEGDVFAQISGGGDEAGSSFEDETGYIGSRGLPPELLADLEVQFNFSRIVCADGFTGEPDLKHDECEAVRIPALERFLLMMWNYLRFDFGESHFRSIGVLELVLEKLPVSLSLGLWSVLLIYLVSIPLGVRKAVKDGTPFDTWTSSAIIVGYAIPGFLFAILLLVFLAGGSYVKLFPLRGLLSDGLDGNVCAPLVFAGAWLKFIPTWWGNSNFDFVQCVTVVIPDYFWHITLPIIAYSIAGFASLTLLTKNSFLDQVKMQYVTTARAKGLSERRVLYGHVFRNGMLIVISGFPALFIGIFFGGSLIIETIFSLDGLGRLGFEAAVARDFQVIFGTLFFFGLIGLVVGIISDLMYVFIDPRIDFDSREG